MLSVTFLILVLFGLETTDVDPRCDAVINEAIKNWDVQKNYRFPPTAVFVEFIELAPSGSAPSSPPKESIIVSNGTNGLIATIAHGSDGQAGSYLVQMTNDKYYGMVTRLLPPGEPKITKLDQFNSGFRISGFGGPDGNEIWIDRVVRAGISGGFLASSVFDFRKYVSAWRSGKAKMECTISDVAEQPHRLMFSNFTGTEFTDIDHCTFGIDPSSLLVVELDHVSKTLHCHFDAESFFEVDGVKFPGKVTLTHFNSGSPSFKATISSKVLHPDSVGFDKAQLYFTWYGLKEPNSEVVATAKRSSGYLYLAMGVVVAVVSAILFWRKNT